MRYLLNSSHTNAGNDENADPKPKRSMLKMFIMNFVLPGIIFNAVKTRTSLPIAYLISGIPPVLDAGKNVIASKSLDPISALVILSIVRSEERRVGKECVSTCRSRWSPYH